MKTITIDIPDEFEGKLNSLSQFFNIPKGLLLNKALEIALEDLEDIYLAEIEYENFKKSNNEPISLKEMEKRLGLGD